MTVIVNNTTGIRRAGGTVLIATMWIMIVVTGLVLVLARSMRIEGVSSANYASAEQARAVEHGALQYVLANLDGLDGQRPDEEEMRCDGLQVGGGAFWIIRPNRDDERVRAYGLVDEASKLNLNAASEEMMSKIESITAGMPPAIVDWRDEDDEVTPGGAETEYYMLMPEPYQCKNAPFETVEEMLMVRDGTRDLLYGEDANRNAILDPNEDDAAASDPPDNRDSRLDRGLFDLVTVYTYESADTGKTGLVNVNNPMQEKALADLMTESMDESRVEDVMNQVRRKRPFRNLMDFYYRSTLEMDEFKEIDERVTTQTRRRTTGLVNVNTASKEVLLCLPELEESDAAALIAARSGEDADDSGIAWVAEALPHEKATAIGSYITGLAYQFSADIVSVSGDGRAFTRCRIVVDATESPPRVLYRRDLTHLGWPLDPDILAALRAGTPVEEVLAATVEEVR